MYFQEGADGENHIRVGKLNLVDLAGSERQTKTGAAVSHWVWNLKIAIDIPIERLIAKSIETELCLQFIDLNSISWL